ncbi:MAG: PQQ-binding-like beta-propeller repeat protein [Candidatus Anammoximicrobium sp.]|nr:PQQ-binding-like beta-propeller repeat protein [Candidatus Anammoximicrobium sp.]
MKSWRRSVTVCLGVLGLTLGSGVRGDDWPQWGGRSERNMVSGERNLPDLRPRAGGPATSLNEPGNPYVKWKHRLAASTYGNPTVADGRVFVGTGGPDCGRVVCLDEATGRLVWELIAPHREFPTPERPEKWAKASSWDYYLLSGGQALGICSSPTVDGDRVYVVSNRGEVLGLDARGLANGNQGPFTDEAGYQADGQDRPAPLTATDADILWRFDLWTEIPSRPADLFSNSALVHGDCVYLSTGNGVELHWTWGGPVAPPNPRAPSLIALDKHTGRLVAQDDEQIGTRLLHGQFSSPCLACVGDKPLVLYAGGDAVLYAFEPLTAIPDKSVPLRKVWSYDCVPPEYRVKDDNGQPIEYRAGNWHSPLAVGKYGNKADRADFVGPSEVIATPVVQQGRVYVAIGRDPAHGRGRGALHCIDPTKTGDITKTGKVWTYQGIQRSICTASVSDGLVYVADIAGWVHCLDADTGQCYWTHDTQSYQFNGAIWGSPLTADGKVYLVTRKSLYVFAAGKQKQILATVRLGGECSPVAANGVLYVVLRGILYALHSPDRKAPADLPDRGRVASGPEGPERAAPNARKTTGDGHEWPGWRGPRGDGFSPEVPRRLPPKKLLWTRAMAGECHAPLAVGGGYVVAADGDGRRDYWRCFRAVDGTPSWTYEYPNAEKMEYGAVPRAAPRIDGGKVYCLNAWGELFCLELATGKPVWTKHLAREFQSKTPTWGFCCSPLIAHGNLIVNPGGKGGPVAALDPQTGNVVWTGQGDGLNYSSFLLGVFGGVEQLVGYDRKTAGGWDVKTGQRLWTLDVDASYGYIAPAPVAVGDKLLLTSDQQDARLLAFTADGKIVAEPVAENMDLAPEIATPCAWGGQILAASSGLLLLEGNAADSGESLKTLWLDDSEDFLRGLCHAIVSDDRALVLCEDGQLLLLATDRKSCTILDRVKLCDHTWVFPALANGRLYVRDRAGIYCYDMRTLEPAAERGPEN